MRQNKKQNKQIGKLGEDIAAKYLIAKDYLVLERNWGNKWGEIDLICRDGAILVFVEVKTKRGITFGRPEEMVDSRKLQQIKRMAALYSAGIKGEMRIDVVAVILNYDLSQNEIIHYSGVY